MEAAAKLIVFIGEFSSRVEGTENHFHPRLALLRVNVYRHTTTIVGHSDGAILIQGNADFACVTAQRLIDTVVDNLLGKVIGAGRIGVHTGAFAHRLKSRKDFNIFSGVLTHCDNFSSNAGKLELRALYIAR